MFDINLCLKLSSPQCHPVESDSCAIVNRSVHTSPHQVKQTAMLNQLPAVLHRVQPRTTQTNVGLPRTETASKPRGGFCCAAEHNLCAAMLNSVKLREHRRFCCSITAPLAASHFHAELTAARRRRGNPRSGLASVMALSASKSRVVRGSLQQYASVSETSSRRGGTVTCTAVSERNG